MVAQVTRPDLSHDDALKVVNRKLSLNVEKGRSSVHVDARPDDGVVWIDEAGAFSTGTVELDIKGKDALQQSFVGLAFHGTTDTSFEVIYFRPFNFQSTDSLRRSHAVQYVALPGYDWQALRSAHPGVYEHAIGDAPAPNEWFHARITVSAGQIAVYVNGDSRPCLIVTPLAGTRSGRLGFWVGNNSDGDFSNLVIQPKKNP